MSKQMGKKKGAQRRARAMMRRLGFERLSELPKTEELETLKHNLRKERKDMTEEYIDTADLAEMVPDGYPGKARLLYANATIQAQAQERAEERAVDELVAEFTGEATASAVDLATEPEVPAEEGVRKIKAQLRDLAAKILELENESDPPTEEIARLRKRYRELQKKLRDLPGGDAPTRDRYQGDDLSERTPGSYFGADEFLEIAKQPDPEPTQDELDAEEIRRQALEEEDDLAGVSDEEMWRAVADTWGLKDPEEDK